MAKHEDTATTMLKMMEMFLETTKKMEERALKMEERAEKREQKMEERAEKREQLLLERLAGSGGVASVPARDTATVAAALASRIVVFEYDEESGCTFDKWITRFEDVVKSEGSSLEEADRTSLLVSKLDSRSYAMYVDHILPKKPAEASYEETKTVLEELFGEKCSLFRRRFNAFRVVKEETEDFKTYAARVNQLHERGRVKEMSEDDCKCMLFVAGMQEGKWKDLRKRLIRRLEIGDGAKLRDLVTECELSMSLVKDAVVHVQEDNAFVARVDKNKWTPRRFSPVRCSPSKDHDRNKDYSRKKGACFLCGETGHYANSCPAVRNVKAVARLENGRKDVTACIGKDELDVVMQLDTGADVTIVDRKTWRRLGSPSLGMASEELRAANGSAIEVDGVFNTVFKVNGFPGKGRCYVTKNIRLMGMEWIEQLPSFQEAFASTCCAVKSAGYGKKSGRRPNVWKAHDLQGTRTRIRMEQDCIRQRGVGNRDFVVDDLVFVRDYRKPTKPTWTPGRVVGTRGRSLCEVEISKKVVWTCYTRDLRPRGSEEEQEDALTILLEDFDLAWPTKKKLSGVVGEEPTVTVDVLPSLKHSEEMTVEEEQRLEEPPGDECAEPTEEDAVEKTADQEDTSERPRAVQFSEEEEESTGTKVDDSSGSRRTGSSTREGRSPVLAAAGQRPRRDRAPPRRLDMDPRQKKYKLV